ncbi:MAG: RNA methyltransferase [Firmicutes bacterium]|jgi:TrmH family RNA methyltransferase|nr:RNA methyltransferase [Bacillota bacterium]
MVLALTSSQNPQIKEMRSLYSRKGRDKTGLIPVEGSRFVTEALAAAKEGITTIETVFFEDGFDEGCLANRELIDAIGDVAGKVYSCPPSIFRTLTSTESPQGIVAAVRRPSLPRQPNLEQALYLVVDRVQDPGNLGTMVRTAAAANANGVLCLKGTVDPYNPKTLRATMGTIFRIPIEFYPDPESLILELNRHGCQFVAADVSGDLCHFDVAYADRTAIVVGNEGQGIDPKLLAATDVKVRIPLAPDIESLNAAVACGILLYEVVRYRHLTYSHD